MKVINLTQHPSTPEQRADGVFDLEGQDLNTVKSLLTFNDLPSMDDINHRARELTYIAANHNADAALIGGAPYLMSALERHLKYGGITPLYAFTKRVSKEETMPDGSTRKVSIFKHLGFIEV